MDNLRRATNSAKMLQIDSTLASLLEKVLTRGFYGKASVEFTIQDGMIQDISRKVEQRVTLWNKE